MAPKEVIVNGDFNLGSTGWSGTDLETNHSENAYLGNGSSNRVAEMDGRSGFTTVMEQTFTVDHASETKLTFDTALRTASNGNAGSEGFRVDILDSTGAVIATQQYFPTSNSFSGRELAVSFPAAGDYTLRLTELGPDDSLGAIVDNFSLLICFVKGTRLRTATGRCAVEDLSVGDRVWTQKNGYQPLRWISSRRVSLAEQMADPKLRPIRFARGALGAAGPDAPLLVSPQHRMVLRGGALTTHFGLEQALAPAVALVNGKEVTRCTPMADLEYYHFLFDRHEIVQANGLLSESFYPGTAALGGVDHAARQELFRLFPELAQAPESYGQTALPTLRPWEASLLAA